MDRIDKIKRERARLLSYRFSLILLILSISVNFSAAFGQDVPRERVAVLDLGATELGRRAAGALAASLSRDARLLVIDRDQTRAAAAGAGYTGSLNLTLEEARNLGSVIDCDFFLTGDAENLRRSPSSGPVYYEAYASVFIVSARTGRLILWERPSFEAATPTEAERLLFAQLGGKELSERYGVAIRRAQEDERRERARAISNPAPLVEDASAETAQTEAHGLRLPQPYRRLRPPYTEAAASIELEATVDVAVEIGADGEVSRVDVVRWAGFGLDEATSETVRRMHFRPAMRDGLPVPVRVLLRYNFRKPPKQQ